MEFQYFLSIPYSLMALVFGIAFGFLLRKATVSRFDTIVGQLLLKDHTVMKVIFTAIVVGNLGIYFLGAMHLIPQLHLSKTPILWSLIGGGVFGVGMSIAGYCPGTAIAALGEGSKDMIVGLFGMLFGSVLFNELSPILFPLYNQKDSAFQQTFASFYSLPNGVVMMALLAVWIAFAMGVRGLERKKRMVMS